MGRRGVWIRQGILLFVAPRGGCFYFILFKKGFKNMKKTLSLTLIAALLLSLVLVSCSKNPDTEELWKDAIYTQDTEFGSGAVTVFVEVKAAEKSVTFTLKTDKTILGDALMEHSLLSGEAGQFGLYVKSVNGIVADYDINQSYWGFYKDGEYMMTGVDSTEISNGEHYELVYTK